VISFDAELAQRLAALREQNLFREFRRVDSPQSARIKLGGQKLLSFASNDYLGLANDPCLKEAAARAVQQFGAGAGASRLVGGSLAPFHELEESLAIFKQTEAALSFATGYAAAAGAIGALIDKQDVIILDKLVHASIVDAARLSGATIRVFAHNDLDDLEDKLKWANATFHRPSRGGPHILIVTESVFSMDGDTAPLREIVALKEKHGAWLMVDEAHATGVFGDDGRGLGSELGVGNRIEIQMGTLGKALGASGGFICGSRALIELLVNRARSFIFSTAPVPAAAAAATAAIRLIQSPDGKSRRATLQKRIVTFHASRPAPPALVGRRCRAAIPVPHASIKSAIIPVIVGDEHEAVAAAAKLGDRGIFVPAIRYPSVARGAARLRVSLTAAHTNEDVSALISALSEIVNPQS
jgi:8-amino-7-oxononanoate synthase